MKGLRQNVLDFEVISTSNTKTLVFIDASDYIDEHPERPLLEVTLPGYNKYFLVNVIARQVNTFNSNTIGLTSLLNDDCLTDLPDGVYKFKYKICPYSVNHKTKRVLRTSLLDVKIANVYEGLDAKDCDPLGKRQTLASITEALMLLEGAKALVDKNEKKAVEFYRLADSLINKLSNCCN